MNHEFKQFNRSISSTLEEKLKESKNEFQGEMVELKRNQLSFEKEVFNFRKQLSYFEETKIPLFANHLTNFERRLYSVIKQDRK